MTSTTGDEPRTLGIDRQRRAFLAAEPDVGKIAPEIDGADHEGKALQAERLSAARSSC